MHISLGYFTSVCIAFALICPYMINSDEMPTCRSGEIQHMLSTPKVQFYKQEGKSRNSFLYVAVGNTIKYHQYHQYRQI
ncbi:hypothetical protein VN97_g2787 [Penicillium thymicola]|uniref:Uncharacterized protein n=1 Tax=Penicillium thymicola TaxID=293382 RepID=A0AAI9TNX6_PENTH|nr:hypothetical protein VN97_g2787 [Penicillium thymicola]